jgi:hypothetical protein
MGNPGLVQFAVFSGLPEWWTPGASGAAPAACWA